MSIYVSVLCVLVMALFQRFLGRHSTVALGEPCLPQHHTGPQLLARPPVCHNDTPKLHWISTQAQLGTAANQPHLPSCALLSGQSAFVITLARAGEDNVRFRLTDLDSTFAGFAGADYDLQVRRMCMGGFV